MPGAVLSPRARADLDGIWDFSAEAFGEDQAEAYLRQIAKAIDRIAQRPSIGKPCDDIRTGYRKLSVGSHMIFYRITEDVVDVVRILHQRMDFDQHL